VRRRQIAPGALILALTVAGFFADGPAAALPWIVAAAGLILAAAAGAPGVNAARRARTQEDLDRVFAMSSDVISIADFDGYFTRLNPASARVLGYSEEELLARPYLDFVHPDDRERTAAEAATLCEGQITRRLENRFVRKDGSERVLEWTATAVPEDRAIYAVARDVTERRRAETEAERLAEEQAALRRVAELVARDAPQMEVFAKVAEELASVVGSAHCALLRDNGDGSATVVAQSGGATVPPGVEVGSRVALDGGSVTASVIRQGKPIRLDDYSRESGTNARSGRELGIRSAVGLPVLVRGRVWGVIGAGRYDADAFPADAEIRMARFAGLVATAIGNAEARAEVERLAEQQAALRRVATLVAEGAAPTTVFDAVAIEMEQLLDADGVTLSRYEPDDEVTLVAHSGPTAKLAPAGMRVRAEPESVSGTIRRTEAPARRESYRESDAATRALVDPLGIYTAVGAPIVVDGQLWGVIIAHWRREAPPAADTEERIEKFAQLLDTAIANADSRDQLRRSRARLLTTADEARRRVVRDLHDGAQQRLVHSVITLKLAQRAAGGENGDVARLIDEALAHAEQGNLELRELAHGILPSVLNQSGLRAGVNALVSRLDMPVDVDVPDARLPAEIEASAYFIVAESLTNVAKHAHATQAAVTVSADDGVLCVEIRDDGIGGADARGHGLVGLADRASALGGRLTVENAPSGGTIVAASLLL
jgi:PAS domain S-box-containing protein